MSVQTIAPAHVNNEPPGPRVIAAEQMALGELMLCNGNSNFMVLHRRADAELSGDPQDVPICMGEADQERKIVLVDAVAKRRAR